MNTKVNKTQVVATILLIFIVTFGIFIFISYQDKKDDINYVQSNIKSRIDNLYDEVFNSMLKRQIEFRTKFVLNFKKEEKLKAFKAKDRDKLKQLFTVHYDTLKEQIKGFKVMHLYDRDGISLLRMHSPTEHGDDLKTIRSCVRSLVQNPRACSFFEVGTHGLAYRHTTPIYYENELLGFFELGITPSLLVNNIKSIFKLEGYFFIAEDFIPNNTETGKEQLSTHGFKVCQFCSKKDDFITKVTPKIDPNNLGKYIKSDGKTYSMISKDTYDAQSNLIGKLIFFQDISIFQKQIEYLLYKSIFLLLIAIILITIILNKYINSIFKKLNKARFLLDNTNDAVYVVDLKDGQVLDVNERASLMLGYSRKEFLNKKVSEFRRAMDDSEPKDWDMHINNLRLKHFVTSRGIHTRKDGTEFPVEANISYVKEEGEEYMIAVARDITLQLEMETKIHKKANELQRLQDVISKAVLYTTSDLNGKMTSVSKAFEQLSGYKESELVGKNHSMFKNPEIPKKYYKDMWEVLQRDEQFVGEIKNYKKDRGDYWIKITIDPLFDEHGEKIGYSSYREDITDKKELEYISTHDALTTIYNRGHFKKELSKKINSAKRYDQYFGLLMFDIDHFKLVNDTYGHQIGDDVLITISSCIQKHIRIDDIFARWGGEEFVIIANGADIEHLKKLAEKLKESIANTSFEPVPKVTASFGLTIYKDGDNDESIQKRVDDALYVAKESGRDRFEIIT